MRDPREGLAADPTERPTSDEYDGMRNRKPVHVRLIEARASGESDEVILGLERELARECDAIRARDRDR
jgi:hypothetical protein